MKYEAYRKFYPDGADEAAFKRLGWEARRAVENAVTGIDGVNKLTAAPPVGKNAAAVRRCQAAMVQALWETERAGALREVGGGVAGGAVTSVTAGAERVTYAAPVQTGADRAGLLRRAAETYLAGARDANGVPLLYAGRYPVEV